MREVNEMKEHIGKKCYIKFGTFHGQTGTIFGQVTINDSERYLIKLNNGLTIPKKVKNVVVFGEVQKHDNYKKK